jgi:hypothetical protein
MLRPSKIIASGSSGLEIARRVIELLYTIVYDDVSKLKAVQVQIVETEKNRAENIPKEYRSDLFIPEGVKSIPRTLHAYLNGPTRFEWFDELYEKYELDVLGSFQDGAGGVRPRGRMALWLNWESVYGKAKMEDVNPDENNQVLARYLTVGDSKDGRFTFDRESTVCYIVGTLGGGTCSGNFLDLAYMVHKHERPDMKIIGIFLVPPPKGGIGDKNRMMMAGVYSALNEWKYYNDSKLGYRYNWPGMGVIDFSGNRHKKTFDCLYLLEPTSATTLAEAYDKVAYRIFLDIIGMEAAASPQRADAPDQIDSSPVKHNLWSFNLCGLVYPKYQLVRLAALKKCAEYFEARLQATDESVNAAKTRGFSDFEEIIETHFINHIKDLVSTDGKGHWSLWVGDKVGDSNSQLNQYMNGSKSADEIFQLMERWKGDFKTGNFQSELINRITADAWGRIGKIADECETVPYLCGYVQGMMEASRDTAEFWMRAYGAVGNEALKDELRKLKWHHLFLKREKQRDTFQFIFYKAIVEAAGEMILQRFGNFLQGKNALDTGSAVGSQTKSWPQTVEDWKNEAEQSFKDHTVILDSHRGETLRYVDRKGQRFTQIQQITEEVEAFAKAVNFADIPTEKKKAVLMGQTGANRDIERLIISQILERNREIRINSDAVNETQLQHSFELSTKPGVHLKDIGLAPLDDREADKGFCNFIITHSSNYQDIKKRSGHRSNSDHNNKPIPMAIEPEVILFYNECSRFDPEKLQLWEMGKKAFDEMVANHAEQRTITFLWQENWIQWKKFTQELKPNLKQLREFFLDYGFSWRGQMIQGRTRSLECTAIALVNNKELHLVSTEAPFPHFDIGHLEADEELNDKILDKAVQSLSLVTNYPHVKAILRAVNSQCQALQNAAQSKALAELEESARKSWPARGITTMDHQTRIDAHRNFIYTTLPGMAQFLSQNAAP